MHAQSRSAVEPYQLSNHSFSVDFPGPAENDDAFPTDLSSESKCSLIQLCDTLFLELDSEIPDLRARERYESVCDELTLRRIHTGVA